MEIEQSSYQCNSEALHDVDGSRLNTSVEGTVSSINESSSSANRCQNNVATAPVTNSNNNNNYKNNHNKNNNSNNNNNNNEGKPHKKKRCRRKKKDWEQYKAYKSSWDDDSVVSGSGGPPRHIVKIFKGFNGIGKQTVFQPMAPNNTNQFLMDDHCLQSTPSPFYDRASHRERFRTRKMSTGDDPSDGHHHHHNDDDKSYSDSDSSTARVVGSEVDYRDDDDDGDQYTCTDFMKEYENYRINTLQAMNKDGLIKECLRLETQLEECQRENVKLRRTIRNLNNNNINNNFDNNITSNNDNNNNTGDFVGRYYNCEPYEQIDGDYDDNVGRGTNDNNYFNDDDNDNNNNDNDRGDESKNDIITDDHNNNDNTVTGEPVTGGWDVGSISKERSTDETVK